MARIVYFQGIDPQHLPPAKRVTLVDQAAALKRLEAIRSEWQEAAGADLSHVTLDLGSLFNDLERIIGG